MTNAFIHRLARKYPWLEVKLKQAGIPDTKEQFLKKTILTSVMMTTGLSFILLVFVKSMGVPPIILGLIPLIFYMMFYFFIHAPEVMVKKEISAVSKEIVFAGRFLMVELESGIDVYNALIGVSRSYPTIGKYMRHIVKEVDLGTSMDDAINQEVELTPSDDLRKLLWQILNSLKTGADTSRSLRSVIEQIVKEQQIQITEYGRKLNPLAMFYMIIAIILPTLGITMLLVISTLMAIPIDFKVLMVILVFIAFMQFMFLSIIRSSRPSVGI
jgi:pilus assembly protein TadC